MKIDEKTKFNSFRSSNETEPSVEKGLGSFLRSIFFAKFSNVVENVVFTDNKKKKFGFH